MVTIAKDAEQLQRIMRGLKCSEPEAREIMAYDKAIDHNEPTPYDLPQDKLNVARKFAHTGTRTNKAPTAYKWDKKPRKADAAKEEIITEIAGFLPKIVDTLEITNKTRLIKFTIGNDTYELTLTRKAKPKAQDQ